MTKINKILAGVALSLSATLSMAQEDVQRVNKVVECAGFKAVDAALKEWGEHHLAQLTSNHLDGKEYPAGFYANPNNGNWSIVEKRGNLYCIVATGKDMKPVNNK